tara:strand:+ start:2017 stop:2307 length:291 start_codon:yes stop_codon:yes gene_type:complete
LHWLSTTLHCVGSNAILVVFAAPHALDHALEALLLDSTCALDQRRANPDPEDHDADESHHDDCRDYIEHKVVVFVKLIFVPFKHIKTHLELALLRP